MAATDFLQLLESELLAQTETVHIGRQDYVRSGALRLLYLQEQEELTFRLICSCDWFNALGSFLSGQPSAFYL